MANEMKTDLQEESRRPSRRQLIIDEIRNKAEDYETNMSGTIAEMNEWSECFTIRKPRKRNANAYSNPRVTEMFRSVNALATLEVRMMTAHDPYFDIAPMDIALEQGDDLNIIQSTLATQLKISEHKRYLLKAAISQILFGTVIVEQPFKMLGLNPFGRRMPCTMFQPRSLLQVAFDRGCYNIDESDYLTTSDIKTPAQLRRLMFEDPNQEVWIRSEMEAAIADASPLPNPNEFIVSRLTTAGYPTDDDQRKVRELMIYRGTLDCLNDGIEYIVGLVNRKYIVRFHANSFQHGRRDFRVARWVEYELEPLAYGLGKLLLHLHKSMDANRQKVQDGITFDTYSMFLADRLANINASDFKVKLLNVIETDSINGLKRIETNVAGATLGLKLEEMLKADFRATSGATDTLQALVTEATASEVTLAQNEAMRNISIKAEIAAEPLVRQHIEIMHANNAQYITEPFTLNVNGRVKRVYPAHMWYDCDFQTKVVTDKDFKPQRLKALTEMTTILTSIRNEHPEKYRISIIPIVKEIARSLNINLDALISPVDPAEEIVNKMIRANLAISGGAPGKGGMNTRSMELATQQRGVAPVADLPGGGLAFMSP